VFSLFVCVLASVHYRLLHWAVCVCVCVCVCFILKLFSTIKKFTNRYWLITWGGDLGGSGEGGWGGGRQLTKN
jgi:hypothetical protein